MTPKTLDSQYARLTLDAVNNLLTLYDKRADVAWSAGGDKTWVRLIRDDVLAYGTGEALCNDPKLTAQNYLSSRAAPICEANMVVDCGGASITMPITRGYPHRPRTWNMNAASILAGVNKIFTHLWVTLWYPLHIV